MVGGIGKNGQFESNAEIKKNLNLGETTYKGIVYRNVGHDSSGKPYNPIEMNKYTINTNHRYTKKGTPGIYFGDSVETVAAELHNYKVTDLNKNRTTFVYDVKINNMLDLTKTETLKKIGITNMEITGNSYNVTHAIGEMAYAKGYKGLIVPSARRAGGNNIVIFDPDIVNFVPHK